MPGLWDGFPSHPQRARPVKRPADFADPTCSSRFLDVAFEGTDQGTHPEGHSCERWPCLQKGIRPPKRDPASKQQMEAVMLKCLNPNVTSASRWIMVWRWAASRFSSRPRSNTPNHQSMLGVHSAHLEMQQTPVAVWDASANKTPF